MHEVGWLVIMLLAVEIEQPGNMAYETIQETHSGFPNDTACSRRGLVSPPSELPMSWQFLLLTQQNSLTPTPLLWETEKNQEAVFPDQILS